MIRFMLLCLMAVMAMPVSAKSTKTRVACVGNSITYGYLLENRERDSYPSQLARLLGEDYEVGNFGHSGATLLRHGHRPYNNLPEYKAALEFNPDIAVIHLGVNDTDPRDWPHYGDEFITDYVQLISDFRQRNPDVRVIIARLTPIGAKHFRFKSGTRDWRLAIQEAIDNVAAITGAELIDFDSCLRDRQNLMPDGIHPDAEGAGVLAATVYSGITGDYGGLKMAPVYQSGMVLQRNRPLTISGTADAGSQITVTLDGHRYRTLTDNRGHWRVITAPVVTGPSYTLCVTDGKDTLTFTDILAGEVWLASGQSNMQFTLNESEEGAAESATANDNGLRIFDMKPVARTDNRLWPDTILEQTDRNGYFTPTRWQPLSPDNAGHFSAVGYHFAKMLRDSLRVPVGIISNATGGAPIEAWTDINTLERGLPEILLDWRRNDYVQPWVQQRAGENTGSPESGHRHPYEPGYLFAAGIRPLGNFPIAGVIWYQGESNAHNIEVHETLFPLWADSWRRHFGDDAMPVYFVQLSSISRPSWPRFRDSQRRLAKSVSDCHMAVSSDLGDSIDVHPRHKRPVGQRLARQALHHTYGFTNLTPEGPMPVRATSTGGRISLTMSNGHGMHPRSGTELRTFEIAGADRLFKPATATVANDSTIIIHNMSINRPQYVRYGWEPYSHGNLVNSEELPASTFEIGADNPDDFTLEPGLEYGVSAPFAGKAGNRLIMAGGCNFPERPMAPDSKKRYYRGIYAADPSTMQWKRIGSIDTPMAYGATAMTSDHGLVLIGGVTETGPTAKVRSMTTDDDGTPQLKELPPLPEPMDNMAAAAIGNKVYAAGGNVSGMPSTSLMAIDLDSDVPKWKRLKDMPGNPRVQPVMAAAADATGGTCLYLWGGFAPRHGKKEPTLETAGLRYSPSSNRWYATEAPVDPDSGEPISTGGGAACTLSDGTIAVCGGVNKDIFLEALRNQAPDYLQHPAEWYRFNGRMLRFHPRADKWECHGENSETARAGAAMVADSENGFYLIGGELKPRIRTAETLHVTYE